MLNELLAKVQAYADERQLGMHRGVAKRVVYSAEEILDGQYLAIAIHFDRDREVYIERLNNADKTWYGTFESKIDCIDTLERELHAYHSLYKQLVEMNIDRDRVLEMLSNENLLRSYEVTFKSLRNHTEPSKTLTWLESVIHDIEMVFECNA